MNERADVRRTIISNPSTGEVELTTNDDRVRSTWYMKPDVARSVARELTIAADILEDVKPGDDPTPAALAKEVLSAAEKAPTPRPWFAEGDDVLMGAGEAGRRRQVTARVNLDEAAANAAACIREHADDPDDGIDGCPNCRLARDVISLVEEVRRRDALIDAALPKCGCGKFATYAITIVYFGSDEQIEDHACDDHRKANLDPNGPIKSQGRKGVPYATALRALDAGKETT